MAKGAVNEKIADLERRRKSMDAEYNEWEPHFRELRDNIQPSRGRFTLGERRQTATLNKKIIDSAGRLGLRTLKSGMMAGVSSPSRPWFKLGLLVHDESILDDPQVKNWLHEVQKRMYVVMRRSNIYKVLDNCYGDLGLYGTFGGLLRGHFDRVVHGHSFPMGMYRIAEDEDGNVDTLHWDAEMTASQIVAKFEWDSISDAVKNRYNNNDLHGKVDICAAVEVRRIRDPLSNLSINKPLGIYYWEKGKRDKLLMESGLGINGILAPRWEAVEGESWSVSSPGMDALGDCVQLQVQHRDKALAIQKMYNPPMQASDGFAGRFRNVPGGITTLTATDLSKGGLRPAFEVKPDVSHLSQDIAETRDRIFKAMFHDLFLMTSEMGIEGVKNVTATAIAEMHEEKLLALGPVLESVNQSLLTPIVETFFHYMQEYDILPEVPELLDGKPISVEFIGLLFQAQKAVGIAAIERVVGFAGTMAQINPNALDKINVDATMDEFADQVGPPPGIIVSTKEAEEKRAARAQQAQQQQLLENAQPLASAANLISEATERGQQGLTQAGVI